MTAPFATEGLSYSHLHAEIYLARLYVPKSLRRRSERER